MERVYLGDWLYNAGIVGFLRIINEDEEFWEIKNEKLLSRNEDMLRFGDNYIEFDRRIFKGFAKKFFNYAFKQYGRYESKLNTFRKWLKELKALYGSYENEYLLKRKEGTEDKIQSIFLGIRDNISKSLNSFSELRQKIEKLPTKREVKKDYKILINTLEKIIDILEKGRNEFWEKDVQIYLRNIYGQKSFLNKTVSKNIFNKFYSEFERAILEKETNLSKSKKYFCISCGERKVKEKAFFDTGISIFYGLNPDAVNFVWNFKPKLYLCDICEIMYFSYFAGLIPVNIGRESFFYFVNNDVSIEELLRENELFTESISLYRFDKAVLDFFSKITIERITVKAKYTLQNMVILEIDLNNKTMPRVYSFNLTKKKAEFFKDEKVKAKLTRFSGKFYKIKNSEVSILPEVIDLILKDEISFEYLNKLIKYRLLSQKKTHNYITNLQYIITTTFK